MFEIQFKTNDTHIERARVQNVYVLLRFSHARHYESLTRATGNRESRSAVFGESRDRSTLSTKTDRYGIGERISNLSF